MEKFFYNCRVGALRLKNLKIRNEFYKAVSEVLAKARSQAYRAINFSMVEAYRHVGRLIVEEEQKGEKRAEYGAFLIRNLA